MSTSWCPECRTEYREGITTCSDCGAALVAEQPARREHRSAARHVELTGPFLPDDDLVELARLNAYEAELVASQLRGARIPAVVFGVGTVGALAFVQHSEGSRVMVRRADYEAAVTAYSEGFGGNEATEPISDEELASQAEAATGWSDPSTGAVV